jgi:hypothetical protein
MRPIAVSGTQAALTSSSLWPSLLKRAAECARASAATTDPTQRQILTHLQHIWVGLANEAYLLGERQMAEQIEKIGEIHAMMLPSRH